MAIPVGEVLHGRYFIADAIGHDGACMFYLAQDQVLDVRRVVKEDERLTEQSPEEFERKAQQLARLHHSAWLRVTDAFTVPGQGYYLVRGFPEGEPLEQVVRRERSLPAARVAVIADKLLDLLIYLHGRGFVTNAIHPLSVWLKPDGGVTLADLGLDHGAYASTYSAASDRADARNDLFSLSLTLCTALTNQAPISGREARKDFDWNHPPLSTPLGRVLWRALAPDPADRYRNAEDMRAELTKAMRSGDTYWSPSQRGDLLEQITSAERAQADDFLRGESGPATPDKAWVPAEPESAAEPTIEGPSSYAVHKSPETSTPPASVVNTGFADATRLDQPLDPALPLHPGQLYGFWLEVGAPVAGSIEEMPTGLPDLFMRPGTTLQVMLFAFEDELRLVPGGDAGRLFIDSEGRITVSVYPTFEWTLPGTWRGRLYFPVFTPDREGRFRLRCNIYCNQVLVQSRLVTAGVMRAPQPRPGRAALSAALDYTLSQTLSPAHLAQLAPHQLSLMMNANGDGTHSFRFAGTDFFKSDASLDGQTLQDLVRLARGALRRVAWGDEAPWDSSKAYRYGGSTISAQQLQKDLVLLAIRGYRFYDALINRLAGGREKARQLARLMAEPGRVQVALKEAASHVFPAALFYDYAFDTGAPPDSYTLCPAFMDARRAAEPLEDTACFRGGCPSRGLETVICPSGFWGYRHALGLPLSVAEAPDAPGTLACPGAPEFTVGVSTDPAMSLRVAHVQALRALHPALGWHYADTRDATLDLLKTTQPHVVYFYCHGGLANNVPYIQVGPPTERGITRDNLRFQDIYWEAPRPLVFINGCHTTAVEPEQALELVSGFVGTAGAAGVIGTEITVFEPLARAFAEACLGFFVGGEEIGAAVRRARLALLKVGNPLGLAYIPFVLASLRLTR